MKDLLTRIKRKIRDRRIRRLLTQLVSAVAAVVIFMTTYALVLPAITMEGKAKCGMEAHQHDDSCYEEVLVCDIPESDGHHHDDSCYKVSEELVCNQEEHQHSDACYDEEGNLICELSEHTHGKDCYEEKRELVCEIPESEGHHHDASCYKKVLTCGKEAHTHSEACYQDTEQDSASGNDANPAELENTGADSSAAGDTDSELTDADNAGTAETVLPEQKQEAMVPNLDSLDFRTILNKETGVYYYHVKPEEKVEDSSQITDWTRAKDNNGNADDSTELTSDDLIRVYLSYTIPGGSLNTTNPTARYRLPDSIRLSDKQIKAINKAENGISRQYDDKDKHDDALGAEAIEGTRRPDQDIDDYIEKNGQEYISATVKAENVFNDKTGEYEGQDLIFTFAPYTVEKNQNVYDAAGEKTKSGEKVRGWFTFDLTTDQVEWSEASVTKSQAADVEINESEDENTKAQNDIAEAGEESVEGKNISADSSDPEIAIERSVRTADIIFVKEGRDADNNRIEEIETALKLVEETETETDDTDDTPAFAAGTLETSGDGYKITLDYTAEAQIPENASLSVREITAETDPEAYKACLEQASKKITSEDSDNSGEKSSTIDEKTSRFFDIEIVVTETDENGQETNKKIEPKAEVSVNIQITDTAAKTSGDSSENADENDNTSKSKTEGAQEPTVLHFTDDGVEKLESTVVDEKNAVSDGEGAASENNGSEDPNSAGVDNASTGIQFTTDSFSIYGVVYTVDFHAEVISASGDTYEINVRYEADAKIPEGAVLRVREILPEDEEYKAVQEKADKELVDEMKNSIPGHPVLFDIAIYNGETEIEPAPGSSVQVEIKLQKDSVTGLYSDENSPLLINEQPINAAEQDIKQQLQVIHDVKNGSLEVVDVTQADRQESSEEIIGQFETDSFSNWLLYLDEEFPNNEITVYQGDSITLRPYGEWYWKKEDEPAPLNSWNWQFPTSEYRLEQGPQTVYTDYSGGTRTDYGITKAVTHDGKYTFNGISRYDRELKEYYWFYDATLNQTGEFYLHIGTNGSDAKKIKVKVIPRPANDDGKPGTVQGTSNVKVNIFDYDKGGVLDEGLQYGYRDYQGNWHKGTAHGYVSTWDINHNLSTDPFGDTVNNGHKLKFLSSGSGGSAGLNGYTNQYSHQGLVQDTLPTSGDDAGYPKLSSSNGGESLKYLFDPSATWTNTGNAVQAYTDVGGLFQKDNDGYYYYNSNQNYAYYDASNNQMILYEHTYTQDTEGSNGVNGKPIGFFPFHEYNSTDHLHVNQNKDLNHHFGMSMQVEFALPESKLNNGNHIIYEFSGDDDLWVYVDNTLVLDIGGIHQPVRGYIDFTDGTVYVYGKNNNNPVAVQKLQGLQTNRKYKLDMFYLERGGCDSNLSVKFNLPLISGKAQITKKGEILAADGSVSSEPLPGAVFSLYDNEACTGDPIKTVPSDSNGIVLFDQLEMGITYYMKETSVPDNYNENNKIYKVEVLHDTTANTANIIYVKNDDGTWSELENSEVVNTKEKTSVIVKKQWQNSTGAVSWPNDIDSVTVGLYSSVNGSVPQPVKEGTNNKTCELNAENTQYTFTDLFKTDNDGNTIVYSVKEESVTKADGSVVTPDEANIIVSSTTANDGSIVITNVQTGSLKIKKSLTYNGKTTFNDKAKLALKGTYTFTIYKSYTDSEHKTPYLDNNGQPKTVSITIDQNQIVNNMDPIESEVVSGLPVGTYWLEESELSNGVYAVTNPVEVTVTANDTATAPVEAAFWNDFSDGPDEAFISVTKKFTGIRAEDIAKLTNFKITLTDSKGNTYVLEKNTYGWQSNVTSTGETVWSWKISNIPITETLTYTVSEEGYEVEGYNITPPEINGVTLNPSTMEFVYKGKIDTTNSHTDWDVESTIFAASLTKGVTDNKKAIIFITKKSLSLSQRKAVTDKLIPILKREDANGNWDVAADHIYFYSVDVHPDGFSVQGESITFDVENRKVTFSATSVWKHVAYALISVDDSAEAGDINVQNDYHEIPVDLDIIKVDKDTIDSEEKQYLDGAEFTITQLDEKGTGNYKEKPDSTTIPKELFYQETVETNNGQASIEGLLSGYYEIKETKAPDGYNTVSDPFYIKINNGHISRIAKTIDNGTTEINEGLVINWLEETSNEGIIRFEAAQENQNASFIIGDEKGAALPNTGGPGTTMLYLLGITLIGLAGAGYVLRWRSKAA